MSQGSVLASGEYFIIDLVEHEEEILLKFTELPVGETAT